MVLIEDAANSNNNTSSNNDSQESSSSRPTNSNNNNTSNNNSSNSGTSNSQSNTQELTRFVMQDKISFVLWLTRIFSILCTFAYLVPIFGYDQNTLYSKAIMSSAATSALRLHQRMTQTNEPFRFSREYLNKLILEDSFHYLLYSFIFLNTSPMTIVLVPVVAFAVLHVSVYTKTLINMAGGPESFGPIRKLINLVISKDKDIMRFIAVNEIILAPFIIMMIFVGKCGIFVPFIYYRFICMRYQSRRNPYSRIMFYEFRATLENYTNQPSCPQIFRNVSQRLVALITRFAPQQVA